MGVVGGLKGLKSLEDFAILGMEAFPKTSNSITAFTTAMKGAEGATGKLKATFTGLNAAMKANPVGATIAIVTALVAIISKVEKAYDDVHDNLDDLSEKGKEISDRLSETRSEIENVDEQIAELEQRKLNITDLSDIDNLNTQIELLKQRKELLDAKASNEKEEAKNNAEKKIEGTKTNSVYSGAKYADGYSGKFSKWDDFWNYAAGDAQLATYSAEEYVNTLENRLSSIHPGELESVIDNLNEIYETYDEIAQNNELVGTEAYETAIKKQEQINELLNETQYLQSVRNNLDKEYIDNIDGNKITNARDYESKLSSLIMKSYSNNGININDVNSEFGGNVSKLEQELQNQGHTLEDYVVWINSAAASQIEFLNSINGTSSATSFKSYSKTLNEYKDTLSEIQQKNIDLSQTQFGNIDTNNRQLLEWNDLNLSKFKDELISWNEGISWDDIKNDLKKSVSTIYGSVAEFDDVPIAFSPILQTDNGAELLNKNTVNTYITSLINEATKDGSQWTNDELLKLDATGLNIEGQKIKGLIADIGDTAYETSENMHYLGSTGALGQLKSELSEIIESMPTVDLETETESFTKLNSAIKETSEATGLTTESISTLKSRFGELSQYDVNKLFENTSNGVRVNREEFEKLEHQQEQITKTNLDTKLNALKEKYKLLTTEMDNCNDKNSVSYAWNVPTRKGKVIYEASGGNNLNGTLSGRHKFNGTLNQYGKANASGDWGAKRTETSLMGEIAPEIWVHSDTGKWELVNYPQFRKVKKGDIIFNGSQTKELLNSGSTNAFGDAFLGGTAYSGKVNGGGKLYGSSNNSNSSSTSSSKKSSSGNSKSS